MKTTFYKKQIIQQGGSYVVTIPKNAGFVINDVVDITVEHSQDFESQADQIFARIAGQKMREKGTDRLTITLKEVEQQEETKESFNETSDNTEENKGTKK
jgi:hypothetical protein